MREQCSDFYCITTENPERTRIPLPTCSFYTSGDRSLSFPRTHLEENQPVNCSVSMSLCLYLSFQVMDNNSDSLYCFAMVFLCKDLGI
jgi:hypothetical protein